MALEPITTSGPTITVSTAAELSEAYELLSQQAGGGTILLQGGDYDGFYVNGYGGTDGDQPVVIASANPDDPAMFTKITLTEATNIRFEGIHVDSTDVEIGDDSVDFLVKDSDNIQIVDSTFTQDADNALKDAGVVVDRGVQIRDSSQVLFEGNYVNGYLFGLMVTNVSEVEIIENELTNIQGDGFRGGGLQDVTIADNYFHDFYGSDYNVTHNDLIQVWGTNAYLLTENLTISGNTLITSDASSQSIFIRNEEFGKEGDSTNGYFQNITITDNLIYNSHLHGIRVDDTDGILIDNNTVLWNPDATHTKGGGDPIQWEPKIVLKNTLDATVTDNLAVDIVAPDGTTLSGNVDVDYHDTGSTDYVGRHFVNPFAGADVTLEDLYMLPSSSWYGVVGASTGTAPEEAPDGVLAVISPSWSESDQYEMNYDASLSQDATGYIAGNPAYSFHWTFDDGTTAEGVSVAKIYETGGFKGVELDIWMNGEPVAEVVRNFDVATKDIFAFDFEDGVADISDGSPDVDVTGETTPSHDGTGFLIGDYDKMAISRWSDGVFDLDTFGLALDLTPTGDEPSGVFLHLYQTMEGQITDSGYFKFSLTTDEGTYELTSRDPIFDDGETHRIGIAFNGDTGQLELFADGESVSSMEAWGTTPPTQYWGMVFGNTWDDGMDAIIDNVEMSIDPSVAGELFVVDPPAEEPPAEEPPAEEPPAEEPPAEEPPAEEPPAEEPPAEEPPAEEPPAEEPPAEEPPAEEPPAEEPPAEEDPRGQPKEAVESGDSGNFLSKIFDMFLAIFGGGSKGSKATEDTTTEEAAASYDTTLADVVPITGMLEDDVVATEEEEDEFTDLAA